MRKRVVAERYAAALLLHAEECNEMVEIYNDLLLIKKILTNNPVLIKFFVNPRIHLPEKKEFLRRFISNEIRRNLANFLNILLDKARIWYLPEIIEEYQKLYNKKVSQLDITVVTAIPINPEIIENLRNKLSKITNKSINLKEHVEPMILGGMILFTESTILDGSIRKRLYDLKTLLKVTKR